MILPIIIDTSDLYSQFEGITRENIDNLCDNVAKGLAAGYARQLEQEAQQALHQTRKRYIESIKLVDSGKLEGTVLLDYSKDPLVRMLEEGASAFDIKEGFFKSAKVKFTKDGRKYLTIPFRLATPGAVAESDVFSGRLPEEVYEVIKNKVTDIPTSGGGSKSRGLTIGEIPQQFQLPGKRTEIKNDDGNVLLKEYQHKNSLYEGAFKQKDAATGQNTYHSFRRVSEGGVGANGQKIGSDPDSWIHGGITAKHLIDVALANYNVEHEVGIIMNHELSKLGFDVEE